VDFALNAVCGEALRKILSSKVDRLCHSEIRNKVMKGVRKALQVCISLVAFAAYASAANRCALAPAEDKVAKAPSHEGCPGHESPGKSGKTSDTECCKTFPTAWVAAAKNLVAFDAFSFASLSYFDAAVPATKQERVELHPLELDIGPPFAASFAESVLQRSILAHAPPLSLS
jgi:hypothetical protein